MAIISLRAYNREIEGMIDNGQLDEAVAHCRHILATFPKYIATYRLLGKAHLEQQRISDATDIFQRVLSAIPDDFVSNVGMSIIREDENNLDAAIWHMELAYEAQPANVAIQDELRRLYGRRDGMQPPRVRLTRGALARMYAKGGLYDQAVAELRAAIVEDPNRPDLQLLLAQMLFQTAQRVDAVDTCVNLLKKIPLCLEANRILAISLPDAENSEVVRNSRQLVISMDPYYAFAETEAVTSEQVPDSAVTIERLDYKSGIQGAEVPEQPAWASSLGISMEKPGDENIPDWLKAVEAPSAGTPAEKPPAGVSPFIWDTQEVEKIITDTSSSEGEVPDWMKDAGWTASTGEAQPPAPITDQPEEIPTSTPAAGDLAQADIPEWLRGIAPDGFMAAQGQQVPGEGEKLSNPWLEPHQPGPTDSIIQWLEEEKPVSSAASPLQKENVVLPPEDEMPDWLKDIDIPQTSEKEDAGAAPAIAFTAGLAAFLQDAEKPAEPEVIPAELEQPVSPAAVEADGQAGIPPALQAPPGEASAIPRAEEELPDWLKDIPSEPQTVPAAVENEAVIPPELQVPVEETVTLAETVAAEEPHPSEATPESKLPEVAGAFLAAEMLSRAAEKPSEAQPEAKETTGEAAPPVVLAAAAATEEAIQAPPAEPVSPGTEAVQPLETEMLPPEPEPTPEPEAFAWLKGLADEQDAQAEQVATPGPEGEIPPPEWVKLEMEPESQENAPAEPATISEPQAAPQEEVPEWIKGLGEEPVAEQLPIEPAPAAPAEGTEPQEEELPAWLSEMKEPEAAGAPEEPLEWEPEELPTWLKEITESEEPTPAPQPVESEPSHVGEVVAAAAVASLIHGDEAKGEDIVLPPPEPVIGAPAAALVSEEVVPAAQTPLEAEQPPEAVSPELTAPAGEALLPTTPGEVKPSAEQAAAATLADARSAVTTGEPSTAVTHYSSLIKQNYHVDEIIKDLQEALYRYPVDVDMWVTLGDAHIQTNDLKEALFAYSRAEELVR